MASRSCGTRAKYVVERCHCGACKAANAEYERRRLRAICRPDEGWAPYVDAGPAREHVAQLGAAGVGYKTVARCAGLGVGVVAKLVYGARYRGCPPSKRIRSSTAEAILAVTIADGLAGSQLVPAGPTWERLDDLVAKGYTKSFLARALGSHTPALQVRRIRVRSSTARRVEDLYRRLEVLARLNGGHPVKSRAVGR